jgi:hypothetical protein
MRPPEAPPLSAGEVVTTGVITDAHLSTVSGACPVAVMKCARWRPADLPYGGQKNCPESDF